jgi:hypothetical protein
MKNKGDKKGLSTIVTTLIIILVSLVSIAVIWVVIRNVVEKSSEQIYIGKFTVDLEIKQVAAGNGEVNVSVKRNVGAGDLHGLFFIISDGATSQTFEENNVQLGELGQKTFTLSYSGIVKKVSVAPIFQTASGEGKTGEIENSISFTDSEALKNFGLISLYKFEGNTNDEISGRNFNNNGATLTMGKYGYGYYFNGANNMNASGFNFNETPWSVGVWMKANNTLTGGIMNNYWGNPNLTTAFKIAKLASNFRLDAWNGTTAAMSIINGTYTVGQWAHLSIVYQKPTGVIKLYVDGQEVGTTTIVGNLSTNPILKIGDNSYSGSAPFNGTLDELTIFNRDLSASEIQWLYNTELL